MGEENEEWKGTGDDALTVVSGSGLGADMGVVGNGDDALTGVSGSGLGTDMGVVGKGDDTTLPDCGDVEVLSSGTAVGRGDAGRSGANIDGGV